MKKDIHPKWYPDAKVIVNGEEVMRDDTATGLMRGECQATIHLKKGWNSISVKCVSHWAGPQSFWAGLTSPDGGPLHSVTVSAAADQAVQLPLLPKVSR